MRIPADDETLRNHLAQANLPALLPALAQLLGDTTLLERFPAPTPGMMGAVDGNFPPEQQEALRDFAFETLRAWRDGDRPLPPLPETAELHASAHRAATSHCGVS